MSNLNNFSSRTEHCSYFVLCVLSLIKINNCLVHLGSWICFLLGQAQHCFNLVSAFYLIWLQKQFSCVWLLAIKMQDTHSHFLNKNLLLVTLSCQIVVCIKQLSVFFPKKRPYLCSCSIVIFHKHLNLEHFLKCVYAFGFTALACQTTQPSQIETTDTDPRNPTDLLLLLCEGQSWSNTVREHEYFFFRLNSSQA